MYLPFDDACHKDARACVRACSQLGAPGRRAVWKDAVGGPAAVITVGAACLSATSCYARPHDWRLVRLPSRKKG